MTTYLQFQKEDENVVASCVSKINNIEEDNNVVASCVTNVVAI